MLHWPAGAGGSGVLLTGDTIMVVEDRRWVGFLWSYVNLVPLDPAAVAANRARVARELGVAEDRMVWMNQVHGNGVTVVDGPQDGPVPDTDALVTAAGMRAHLANPLAFAPPGLTSDIARTEGWTFGVT